MTSQNARIEQSTTTAFISNPKMGRGTQLTQQEAMFILALHELDEDVGKICEAVKSSETAIRKELRTEEQPKRMVDVAERRKSSRK